MAFEVNAGFAQGDLFGLQQLALQAGVRLADEQLSTRADHTMPGNSFSGRRAGHGASCSARATWETQNTSNVPISKNTPPRDLFYETVDRIPGHRKPLSVRREEEHEHLGMLAVRRRLEQAKVVYRLDEGKEANDTIASGTETPKSTALLIGRN